MNLKNIPAYELVMQQDIPDIQSEGYLLRHKKSGARVMVLENQDENKVFNIAFRTTPTDSTGVAHIIEHTVLCGSRKFPSKDPFVELAKGSMNTFLNAMTYPDKTMFPVASCNDADFANLMDVYLDAVFFPNIYKKEEIFRQEGWSYQLENAGDELVYNGVVYNEMKGVFSSPEDVLEREILNSLFPDNTYHWESGGDPEYIPDLTYEAFLDFHRKYYHPSNSYIYLYGKMDFEERLNWMDREYLSCFEKKEVDSAIALQKPFEAMARVERKYSIAAGDTMEDNTYLSYNAAVGTSLDSRLANAFAVLEYALLEAPGAPLKQALLDAGIGKDIMSSYDSGIFQPVFSIIAKNANGSDKERFLETVRGELEKIARAGVDEKAIRAAVNIMEFKFREADYGSYPRGLMYGLDVFDSWLYDDGKPFDYLLQLDDYEFLKEQIGTGYYEKLIRTYLLDNPHVSFVTVEPEKGLTARMEQETKEKLARYKASLTEEQVAELVEKTRKLRVFQETPSTKEELEAIPMLAREDMKKTALTLSAVKQNWDGVTVLHHDYATNGIAYIQLLFDASSVPEADLPYLGILKNVLGMVDTEHYGYGELYNEINMNTGGITPGISVYPNEQDSSLVRAGLGIQVRTLEDKIGYSFRMIEEILFSSNLGQEKRLQEIIKKLESRVSAQLNAAGSTTAAVRAMSYFSPSYLVSDSVSGIAFYETVADLEKHFDEKRDMLVKKLKNVLETVLKKGGLLVSFTGSGEALEKMRTPLRHLQDRLGESENPGDEPLRYFAGLKPEVKNEGFLTPSKVQYVVRSGNFRKAGFEYTGALKVLKVIMNYEYLWNQIRVVGGAYGCGAAFGRNGDANFSSYRDPHLRRTVQVYEGIPEFVENFSADEKDMTKYVIGTISDMDMPLPPSVLGRRSLSAWLCGLTYETLQRERDQVLAVTVSDIRALAPLMRAVLDAGCVCALGGEEKLREEKDLFKELKEL